MRFDSKLQIFSIFYSLRKSFFRVSVQKATRYPLGKRPRNGKIHDLAAEAQGDGSAGRAAIGGGFRTKGSSFTGVTRSGHPCHLPRSLARQATGRDVAREKDPRFPSGLGCTEGRTSQSGRGREKGFPPSFEPGLFGRRNEPIRTRQGKRLPFFPVRIGKRRGSFRAAQA